MCLARLGSAVAGVRRPGDDAVLRHDVDDVATQAPRHHLPGRFTADEERPAHQHRLQAVPRRRRSNRAGSPSSETSTVDHDVDRPEAAGRGSEHGGDRLLVAHVAHDCDRTLEAEVRDQLLGSVDIDVCDHDAGTERSESLHGGPPDAARSAGHQGDAALQHRRRRLESQLALLELPVLDVELLGVADRHIAGHRFGTAHHVDGVDVELTGDTRAVWESVPKLHMPTPGTRTIAGSAPRMAGEAGSA